MVSWVLWGLKFNLRLKGEEKISKQKAKLLFDSGDFAKVKIGTFAGLAFIHAYLFEDIHDFAGKIRTVNIAKGNFRFAPLMYLSQALEHIDTMPQGSFDHIIEKYVEMNIAHPFREGNGRATRIWLDLILKTEIKTLLEKALTDQIHDRALFMKGIDVSYFYEGYSEFKTEDL